MITCKFSDVTERDMDLLFLEEFVSSEEFLNIFLSKINLIGASVCEIEHSKMDLDLGESDMTVIVEKDGKKFGLLIEDKIDAIAMDNQSGRYSERGEKGKTKGDYNDYFVFIVAPQKYLDTNNEAAKYDHQVTYEQCLEYFLSKTDPRSQFKAQQIAHAINKQKKGYQVIENTNVTSFWHQYISLQKSCYHQLQLNDNSQIKGSKALWVTFHTDFKQIKIVHKSDKGFVDMEFSGLGEKTTELRKLFASQIAEKYMVVPTGKSAVVRIEVGKIDFKADFESQKEKVIEALSAANELYIMLDSIPKEQIKELFA